MKIIFFVLGFAAAAVAFAVAAGAISMLINGNSLGAPVGALAVGFVAVAAYFVYESGEM